MGRTSNNSPKRATDPRPSPTTATIGLPVALDNSIQSNNVAKPDSSSTVKSKTNEASSSSVELEATSTTVVSGVVFSPPLTRGSKKKRLLERNSSSSQEDESLGKRISLRSHSGNKKMKKGSYKYLQQ